MTLTCLHKINRYIISQYFVFGAASMWVSNIDHVMLRWRYERVNPDSLEQEVEVTTELVKVVWCNGVIYR